MNLSDYALRRDEVLHRITSALEADDRIHAAWLSGSFGRREEDEWSDLDLHIAVNDDHLDAVLSERLDLYTTAGVPLLVQEEMPSDSQPGARFQLVLYPGPVEVDWNIGPESEGVRPLNFRMLVERAEIPVFQQASLRPEDLHRRAQRRLTFFWAMAPIGIKLCGRGDTRRAVSLLDLQMTAYIALWRLVFHPESGVVPNSANPILPAELQATIPLVGPTITPEGVLAAMAALADRVQELHPALRELGVSVPEEIPNEITAFNDLAAQVLSEAPARPVRYR